MIGAVIGADLQSTSKHGVVLVTAGYQKAYLKLVTNAHAQHFGGARDTRQHIF